jgi:hypothetical protein
MCARLIAPVISFLFLFFNLDRSLELVSHVDLEELFWLRLRLR